jgi:small acid-soluble spore protein F (minor alpha/beta-type SASP)
MNFDAILRRYRYMAGRNRRMMSENLKSEIAKELGVYDTVKNEGWGSVSSRDCGRIVQKAIEFAERSLADQQK